MGLIEALELSVIKSSLACLRFQTDNAKACVINASKFSMDQQVFELPEGHFGYTPVPVTVKTSMGKWK